MRIKRLTGFKKRGAGFTLVELLIVIMIIAILAGMMLLAAGSAVDGAQAAKIINDLRDLKSATLIYFTEHNIWLGPGEEASLDMYYDRPLVANGTYAQVEIGPFYSDNRVNIGITLTADNGTNGIRKKLIKRAKDSALLDDDTSNTPYSGGMKVWMNLR